MLVRKPILIAVWVPDLIKQIEVFVQVTVTYMYLHCILPLSSSVEAGSLAL